MWFEEMCKFSVKHFSWIVGDIKTFKKKAEESVSEEFIESLNFTGLDVEPYEVLLLSYSGAIIASVAAVILDIIIIAFHGFSIASMGLLTTVLMIGTTVGLPLAALQFLSEYPKTKAGYMKVHSLGDIPEVLSYIIMYLKLIPNMEDGIRFAARESNTSLGKDLKKLIWDLEVRVYRSMDDAVTSFANLWGKWSDYLKRALHLIRSAVREPSESERNITLDRSLDIVMDGTKNNMMNFANNLHQPTLVIYSIGAMVPLALVAMMPAASLVGLRISIFQIFLLYDIILPLALFAYMRKILLSRPATFNPPIIPRNHPDVEKINKKENMVIAAVAGVLIALPGIFFMLLPLFSIKGEIFDFITRPAGEGGLNAYIPVTLFILWGIATAVSIYCLRTYTAYKKIRDRIKEMEKEFSDSLYVIGKRITEGRPAEEAFQYASETMEGAEMGKIFSGTAFNLASMRTDLKDALFDEKFGSLKHVYSDRIRAIMHLFVEGVKKSYEAAGIAIVKVAEHLKQLQEVERGIKNSLGTLTSTLKSTATLFAPMIAGITLGITKLISVVLEGMNLESLPENDFISGSSNFSFDISPEYFVLVVGIYIMQLVVLLIRFANGIDEGDDKIEYMYTLGKSMPTAIAFFSVVTIMAMIIFQRMAPM